MSFRAPAVQLLKLTMLVMSVFLILAALVTQIDSIRLKGRRSGKLPGTIKQFEVLDSSGLPIQSLFDGVKDNQFNLQNIARLEKLDLKTTSPSCGRKLGKVTRALSLMGLGPSVVRAQSACVYACSGPGYSTPVCDDSCGGGACGNNGYCGHWNPTNNQYDCRHRRERRLQSMLSGGILQQNSVFL